MHANKERFAATRDLHVQTAKVLVQRAAQQAGQKLPSHDRGSSLRKNSMVNSPQELIIDTDSPDSEKKIDRMAHSLANIEAYLKRMPTTPSPINHQNIPSLAQTPANNFASPGSRSLSGSSGVFVDHAAATDAYDATPNTHSVHASKVIEQAVGENSSMNRNPALTSALASLKEMLGGINEHPNTADLSKTLWTRPIEKAPPPSRAEIYEILRRAGSE